MKNNGKIRSNFVKESLLEYNKLANALKENTESAVRGILQEAVRDQYAKILAEDEDYDVEEVDDTDSENTNEDDVAVDDAVEGMESDDDAAVSDDEEAAVEEPVDGTDDDATEEVTDEVSVEDDGNEWSDFDKYKVSDGEYDFSSAEDDEIVKVYKLLKDDDQVVVTKDDDKVSIKDNETGAEYLIDMSGNDEAAVEAADDFGTEDDELGVTDDFGGEEDIDNQENDDDMNESRIFEIALNEYDSNVGYTDNYQKKDVMTSDGVAEPGKNVNDWDKGVPHDTKKPWSGKKGDKSENQPFDAEKGKTVEEGEDVETVEEATNVGGFVQQNSTSKSHVPNSNGRSARSASKGGKRIKGTVTPRYDGNPDGDSTNESIKKKAEKIFAENKQLKKALMQFKSTLEEAAVTNVNLGNIIKLVMENSTSMDEKKEIISRFGNEAKTVENSKALYESISNELKKKSKMNIDEEKEFAVKEKINETQIYRSNDMLNSLDLMHRICM